MSPDVRIGYLVDHPEALPTLERLFQSEWAAYYCAAGPGNAHQDLVAYSKRGQLPVGLVAFLGSEPCGVAALKADSISTHKHLTPWIGGGMVAPQFRRHGIGARLVSALEDVARNLGFTTIYSGPSTANSLLTREGGAQVSLDFRCHHPENIVEALRAPNLAVIEQVQREAYEGAEYPSRRCYLVARAV